MQTDSKQTEGAVDVGSNRLLGISGVPRLCNKSACEGCGNEKLYRGKEASSLVCCRECWKKLPKWMRDQFTTNHKRHDASHGPTIWENRIAVTLLWLKDA